MVNGAKIYFFIYEIAENCFYFIGYQVDKNYK
jgi:hypothetical protein